MTDPQPIPPQAKKAEDAGRWISASIGKGGFRTEVKAGDKELVVDEPVSVGGSDLGPTPYEYLLTSLASCTLMTLRMYADRKSWPLESASIQLRSGRSHEIDCEKCESEPVGIGHIQRRIELTGPITDEQRQRLLQVADRCPIKQTLERGIHIENA